MGNRFFQQSFAGGEISYDMYGRLQDVHRASGLGLCRNFITTPQGMVENRAGFEFVTEVKDSTQRVHLITFAYSVTQTMIIEMGVGYFRFHTNGATVMSGGVPYELANPYLESELEQVKYVQSADVMTLTHVNHPPMELRRYGATNWQLVPISFYPPIASPLGVTATPNVVNATYNYSYVVTAVALDKITESEPSIEAKCTNNIFATGANNIITWSPVSNVYKYNIYKYKSGMFGFIGQTNGTTFTDDNIGADMSQVPPLYDYSFVPNGIKSAAIAASGTGYTTATASVTDATGTGAVLAVNISAGGILEINIISQGKDYSAPVVTVTGDGTGCVVGAVALTGINYPSTASYYEQRRCFAGTTSQPQHIWMTKSGTESTMAYSLPTRADDRISFRIASREVNSIRHILPLSNLLLLTDSTEWRVTSMNSDALTPTTINVKPQSYIGASDVPPLIVNNSVLYVAGRGGHIREMAYQWQANGYQSGDLSLRASHLFDNFDIVDICYAKAPSPLVWIVSTSGKLIGLTYIPEQQVGAWHQHDTANGNFESCATVAEGMNDTLYVVVNRVIGGVNKRYIERLAPRLFDKQEDAFFVDSGLTYRGAPATIISGLDHIEGEMVNILADGAVEPSQVVTGGKVTLTNASSVVHVGIPIISDIKTLPVAAQIDGGLGQGRAKNVNKAWLRLFRSGSVMVGANADSLIEMKQRTNESMGTPTLLKTDELEVLLTPTWGNSGEIFIRQVQPLPVSLVSLTLEVTVGG